MRSLSIAATGMLAQQLNVEVISNNIANLATTGFKRQRPEFQDLLYQSEREVGSTSSGTVLDLDTSMSNLGTGEITRNDQINLKLAVVVTQILPNGNMVIEGDQEVRVNFDLRELRVYGIVRPEDISSGNIISYEKIAEARISYGGRGQIYDVQQPPYGNQILDILNPF